MRLIVNVPEAPLFASADCMITEPERSGMVDEVLYGMCLETEGGEAEGGDGNVYLPVITEYRYKGWVRKSDVIEYTDVWADENLKVIMNRNFTDVLAIPKVQGAQVIRDLPRGARVRVDEQTEGNWQHVFLADGKEGWIPGSILIPFKTEPDYDGSEESEAKLRRALTDTARKYMNTHYRWSGKSPAGIDCSGLCSEAYLLNGIKIFRDSRIEEGFPIHPIAYEELKEGDLVYFPGHIAMYLGNGEYIHSTAAAGSDGVVINSFDPDSPVYREDLPKIIKACGSWF